MKIALPLFCASNPWLCPICRPFFSVRSAFLWRFRVVRFCWGFVRVSSRGIYWRLCYSNSTSTDYHNRSLRRRPSRCWVRCLPILCTLQYPRKLLRMVHDRTVLCGSRLIDWIPYIARFSRRRLLAHRAHRKRPIAWYQILCRVGNRAERGFVLPICGPSRYESSSYRCTRSWSARGRHSDATSRTRYHRRCASRPRGP